MPPPSARVGATIVPEVLLAPKAPIFRVPMDPVFAASVIPPKATTAPEFAKVRVPDPRAPIVRVPELLQSDPFPVTSAELFVELVVEANDAFTSASVP